MTKKTSGIKVLPLILSFSLFLPACDEAMTLLGVAGAVGFAGNAIVFLLSEHSEISMPGGVDTINLRVGEVKPLRFTLKIVEEDLSNLGELKVSTSNHDIADVFGSVGIIEGITAGERQPTGDPRIRKFNTPQSLNIRARRAGETTIKFEFKDQNKTFKVKVSN